PLKKVIETATAVKEVLDKAKAHRYCKTSGATGIHIYIPLNKKYDFEISREFAHVIAELTHDLVPGFTSIERTPAKRKRKVYIDYLQNRSGQTLAAPYSVRPKPKAPVSTPLDWKELKSIESPEEFTIETIFKRINKKGDLFKAVLGKGIDIEKCMKNLGL
ncbi:MAG: DNA ligase, partial [Ignavibacteria bacterium]|nr:DNA ligase [Ignavibacteria bacterium]